MDAAAYKLVHRDARIASIRQGITLREYMAKALQAQLALDAKANPQ